MFSLLAVLSLSAALCGATPVAIAARAANSTTAAPAAPTKPAAPSAPAAPTKSAAPSAPATPGSTGGEISGHLDIQLNSRIWPPPFTFGQTIADDLVVSCLNCSIVGDISLGGGDSSHLPDANFTRIPSDFDFTDTWVGVAIDSFTIHVEVALELFPSGGNATSEIVIHLLGSPQTFGDKEGPLGITATFDPQLHATITTNKAVNFTYGFDITVPPGSAILVPVLHEDKAVLLGFNETTVTPTPLQSTADDLEIEFSIGFRPEFQFNVTLIENIGVTAFADIPRLDVSITQVTNADAQCNPVTGNATVGSTSANGAATVFAQLTKVQPALALDASIGIQQDFATPLNITRELSSACFQFDPRTKTLFAAGQVPNGARSLAASGAVALVFALGSALFMV